LRRLIQSPPNRRELQRACDYVIGQMDLSLESTDNQMNWLGEQLLGFGRIFRPAEIKEKLRRLTPRQIQSAADVFFRPERLNLALVSPLKSDKHLAKSLQL
jgi:predicted Zn-dependent peptidase